MKYFMAVTYLFVAGMISLGNSKLLSKSNLSNQVSVVDTSKDNDIIQVVTEPTATTKAEECNILTASEILKRHNDYRRKFDSTFVTKIYNVKFPKADPPIPNLKWSTKLANLAQKWSENCSYGYDSSLINNNDYDCVRQLLFWTYPKSCCGVNLIEAVDYWFSRIDGYQSNKVCESAKGSEEIRLQYYTFAQIIWEKSTHVGCGMAKCYKAGRDCYVLVVCNYGTTGCYENDPMYTSAGKC